MQLQQLCLQLGRLGGDGDVGGEFRRRRGRQIGRRQGFRRDVAGGAVVLLEGVEGGLEARRVARRGGLDGPGRICRRGPAQG